jgi:F-type H+-transporting ATPase subunit alpha
LRQHHADTLAALKSGKYTKELTDVLEKVAADLSSRY